jgi:nicotinate-nucleotide adenylyltransferase
MKVGLYFGSFNPIHIGHLAIANYMVEFTDIDQLWFMVSPQNPLKQHATLLADNQRYEMVYRAVEDYPKFKASNFEFSLPKPSYTINTLTHLLEKYPTKNFVLIMGSDSLETFTKWKNYKQILDCVEMLIYPRPNFKGSEFLTHPKVKLVDAPLMEISASFIRESIKNGKNIKAFLPHNVWNFIDEMNFYRK